MECKICFEDIESDDIITYNNNTLCYCINCLHHVLNHHWYDYIKKLKTMDCEKSLKNMIYNKVPCYFRDTQVNDNVEIKEFIYHQHVIFGKLSSPMTEEEIDKLNVKLLDCLNELDYLTAIKNLLSTL